jgi:predicted Holliday junction resolvase-like endonuclease
MKRVFLMLVLFLLSVFLFSSVLAIERTPKKDSVADKEQKGETKPEASAAEKKEESSTEKGIKKEETREAEVKKPEKKKETGISKILKGLKGSLKEEGKDRYDYFIDKNGNGIDDRLEKEKTEKKTEEKKTTVERKGRQRR